MTRQQTLEFLRCVLPDEGFYCAVVFNTAHPRPGVDRPRQSFFRTIDELADYLLAQDAAGRTVYHACASYETSANRKQTNARAARALWLDVDCGEGKPYADKEEAAAAVLAMCRSVGLPAPLFVDSGGGIHCYWPFEHAVGPDEWNLLAGGLKAACVRHGLQADPARTADIASILRTPGTHNRKDGERLVQADENSFVQRPAALFDALGHHAQPRPARNANPPQSISRARSRTVIDRIESATAYGTVFADDVADQCAQLDLLRQSGGVEGWFLRVGVLAFCADGDLKAHEWSQNDYPDYDPRVVDDRLARSRGLSGATTCERLNAATPGVCERCPLWGHVSSPIAIDPPVRRSPARTEDAAEASPGGRTPFDPAGQVRSAANETVIGNRTLPPLKEPFKWSPHGALLYKLEKDTDDVVNLTISDRPVYLDTVQTGELDRTRFSYKFCHYLPREGWQEVVIDAKTLYGASGAAELADRGIVLHDHKAFMNYVRHAVTDFHEDEETHVRYDQFGWKNDDTSFLYGKTLYTAAGPVEAIGAKEVQTRCQWIGPRAGGRLEAWTDAADSLFAADMEAYSAVVLSSFAAPLMRFQARDEGGAIIHLFTPGSGQGKTTALTGAWTVWGQREGMSLTNDDTRVAKPIAMGTLANLPVIYDELRDKDPEVIKRMVVMFTEGRDRLRGTVDGTLRHTKATWQTILLSAANSSLIDQIQDEGVDAPAFRVLELSSELPRAIDKTKGDRLKRVLTENAGHAGDAYLRYLCQPETLAWTRAALERWTDEIWHHTGLDSPHRFRVRAVGAIAVAAAIVNKLELVHFNTDRIIEWLCTQIGADSNAGTVSAMVPLDAAVSAFGAFVNAHLGEMLIVPDRFKPRQQRMVPIRVPHNRMSIRYEIATNRVFITEAVFRDWAIERGLAPRQVLDTLERHKVIVARKRQITLSAGTDIPGAQVVCMEVNATHPVMSGVAATVDELQVPHRAAQN